MELASESFPTRKEIVDALAEYAATATIYCHCEDSPKPALGEGAKRIDVIEIKDVRPLSYGASA